MRSVTSLFILVLSISITLAQAAAPAQNYRSMSLAELKKLAEANVPEAQIELASRYEAGRGVPQDSIEANTWYRKAADAGNADAALKLAERLRDGTTGEQAEALKMYRKLAEQGNTSAMTQVGVCYKEGRGTFASPKDAITWFTKAADAGDAQGMFRLGECHKSATGTAADPAKAAQLFKRAADKGHADAARALGDMYRTGDGVEKNPREALNLYTKASTLNNTDAQWALAQMYRTGEGGIRADKEKAIALMKKLAAAKHPEALATLAQLNPDSLKQLSRPLTFVGTAPDERLIGALVRAEGQMKSAADGKWVLVARGLGGRGVDIAVLPPPSGKESKPATAPSDQKARAAAARNTNNANPRSTSGLQVKSSASESPLGDVTNWSRVKDGMPVTLWGSVNEKRQFQALVVKLTPPSVTWDCQLRDVAGLAAGRQQKFTIEAMIKNTGKTPLKNLKLKLRIYQEASPNDASAEYTIETIKPGEKKEFTVDATLYNYAYAGGTSKPKVEMEVLGYDW